MEELEWSQLPSYGPGRDVPGGYKRQEKRGKIVNHVRAPAFAHSLEMDGEFVGDELFHAWNLEGRAVLNQQMAKASEEDRSFIQGLLAQQQRISTVRTLSEADVVKVCHTHILRCVEEIFARLPMGLPDGYSFCSLAEYESKLVQQSDTFAVKLGNETPLVIVAGSASIRPDNLFVVVRNHDKDEPVRFGEPQNVHIASSLEYKGRKKVPTPVCERVIQQSRDDFESFKRREKHKDPDFKLTEEVFRKWETQRLLKFEIWRRTGVDGDWEGFGSGNPWMQQLTAYGLGHNARYVMALDYDGLVLTRFHRAQRQPTFGHRWNLGRGAGGCCQMSAYTKEWNAYFIPAIVGLLVQAIRDYFEHPAPDVPADSSSDLGSSTDDDSMEIDGWDSD